MRLPDWNIVNSQIRGLGEKTACPYISGFKDGFHPGRNLGIVKKNGKYET